MFIAMLVGVVATGVHTSTVKSPVILSHQSLSRRTSNCQIGQKVVLLSHDVSTANVPVKPKFVTNI